jgi:TctA family transporter
MGRARAARLVMEHVATAFGLVLDVQVLLVILGAALFGLFIGAIPGLSATMATALLVPVTFFMPPVPAVAAIVTATAMAIFAGDIPGALMRIPGTPASAAYTDEAYAMTKKGQAETVLGAGLVFSVVGGIVGSLILAASAPALAEIALRFSSFEYFWLVLLGLSCAIFIASGNLTKASVSLMLGLLVSTIGMENPAAFPRFTFDFPELAGGISLIPMLVGLFAVSEVIRFVLSKAPPLALPQDRFGHIFRGQLALLRRYPLAAARGSLLGTAIGALPGAGADIAAWISYAVSKKLSKTPERFGTGHVEGVIESGAANNSALSGAWIPALVFGIPGDSITAIAIGVLYLKNMNPGPTIFLENPANIYAVFIVFLLAQLLMLPLGWAAIKSYKQVLRVPRNVLMPLILLFCMVGAFAINNSVFDIWVMLAFGVLGYFLEANRFPLAPVILGAVLGRMLEENFVNSMIKADGSLVAFFERPIAGALGVVTLLVWLSPVALRIARTVRQRG